MRLITSGTRTAFCRCPSKEEWSCRLLQSFFLRDLEKPISKLVQVDFLDSVIGMVLQVGKSMEMIEC
jgi:hypothetical protein